MGTIGMKSDLHKILDKIEDEQFINPFLLFHLEQTLEVSLPNDTIEIPSFLIENEFIVYKGPYKSFFIGEISFFQGF